MQPRQQLPSGGDEGLDIRDYLSVLRRQWLVIALFAATGLLLALVYSTMQTPIYTARAEVLVQPATGGSSGARLDQLISLDTEARLVTSAPIAQLARERLGSESSITELLKHVSVRTTPETFILDVLFWDARAEQAAQGANAFAEAYLDYKRESALEEISRQRSQIEEQIAELRQQEREQTRILDSSVPGSSEYRTAQAALDRLEVQVAVLASQLASVPGLVDPGDVILPATAPTAPSSPKHPLNAGIGLFLGLFLGIVVAFIRDRGDDRVHDRRDLSLYLRVPVLAYIPHVRGHRAQLSGRLFVENEPRSPAAEAYRTARTSILSLAARRDAKILAIVSPMQREGKTTTSANLAAALGHTDRSVLVVSADLRKPSLHEYFGVPNVGGLSDVLLGETDLDKAIARSSLPNVWVLPGGQIPARPAELLQSPIMAEVLTELRQAFDFVVLDCPPILGLADCLAIVPMADAVFMVVQAEQSRGGAIAEATDQIERVGGRLDGAILNNIRVPRGWPGHQGYGYYLASPEYLESQDPTHAPRARPAGSRPTPSVGKVGPATAGHAGRPPFAPSAEEASRERKRAAASDE